MNTLGVDLYDLHNLRAKYLVFIHDLVQSLRSSGVSFGIIPRAG